MSKAESFIPTLLMHRNVLPQLADQLQDKDLSFQPWEGAMNVSDLFWHILSTGYTFAKASATGAFERVTEKPTITTVAQLKEAIESWTKQTVELIQGMTDDQFNVLIDMTKIFGRQVPAGQLLHSMRDHEIHHKGQLYVYARLCGAKELPFFINLG